MILQYELAFPNYCNCTKINFYTFFPNMFIPGEFYFNVCKQTDRKFDVLLYIWCKAILIGEERMKIKMHLTR